MTSNSAMHLEAVRSYCLKKPGKIAEAFPFGEEVLVYRIGTKIFLLAPLGAVPPRINLKCDPAWALELRERFEAVQPGYHMNKKHWNTVVLDGSIPDSEVRRMIDHSYELVAGTGDSNRKLRKTRKPASRKR